MTTPRLMFSVESDDEQVVLRIANPSGGEVLVTLSDDGPTVTLVNAQGEAIERTWASSQEMSKS